MARQRDLVKIHYSPARLVGDEPGYDQLARELLQGEFFTWPGRMPLDPIFLALVYGLFGPSYAILIYVQALVGTLLVPATYSVLKADYFWVGHPANFWEWPLNIEWIVVYQEPWQIAGRIFALLIPLLTQLALPLLRPQFGRFWPLVLVIGFFTAIHAALISEIRYSESLYPLLGILLVAAGLALLPKLPRRKLA
ncbi:MAG: hypothetical protein AB4911_20005 [Oscillochloridaceae bacterium umkhey_bin13]